MDIPRFVPYLILGLLVAVEAPLALRRRPGGEDRDRGSFKLFNLLLITGFIAGFFSAGWRFGGFEVALGPWATWGGAALAFAGGGLRVWAIRVLGQYFTRTVQVAADQPVIEEGPYHVIRHPSYTALVLLLLGCGLALRNLLSLALLVAPALVAIAYRVHVEEAALVETIGAPYRAYMARTRGFVPYLF